MDDLAKWRSVTLVLAGLKFELKIHDYKTIEKEKMSILRRKNETN